MGYWLVVEQARELFGLDLAAYRYEQLHRRLLGFARRRNVDNLAQYARLLARDAHEQETFLHRFAIGVSEFFRDPEFFARLDGEILPGLLRERASLRIWSAGCSGGHEPYSLAILLQERADRTLHRFFATDLDEVALRKARDGGPFAEKETRNVSDDRRSRFFRRDEKGRFWVMDALRDMITFRRHDLLGDPIPVGFDLISCRNVLIYFTTEVKAQLFSRFAQALRPGGVLFVGATETLAAAHIPGLEPASFGFYVRQDARSLT